MYPKDRHLSMDENTLMTAVLVLAGYELEDMEPNGCAAP